MYCWSCNASNHCLHDISSSENSASKTAVPGSQSHETELGLSFSKHFTDWKSGLQLKRNRQHKVHLRVSRIQFIFSCVSYLVLYQCKWIYNSSTPKQQIAFEVNRKTFYNTWASGTPEEMDSRQAGAHHSAHAPQWYWKGYYFFFLKHAGELRIFVLREEKSPITFPSPYLGLE